MEQSSLHWMVEQVGIEPTVRKGDRVTAGCSTIEHLLQMLF
jgi:hypothetical protein